jgi:hypothetical protein
MTGPLKASKKGKEATKKVEAAPKKALKAKPKKSKKKAPKIAVKSDDDGKTHNARLSANAHKTSQ